MGLFKIVKTRIKKIKCRFFSSLPYSAFKSQLMLFTENKNMTVSLGRFKHKNNLMALRAPKHFKAGKQQYSLAKRVVTVKIIDKNKNHPDATTTYKNLMDVVNLSHLAASAYTVQAPLTSTKSVEVTTRVRVKFKKLR